MTMHSDGFTKLVEECGELIQVAAKRAAYPNAQFHPDGSDLTKRLQEEVADVLAAIGFIIELHELDEDAIGERVMRKLQTYRMWHNDPNC